MTGMVSFQEIFQAELMVSIAKHLHFVDRKAVRQVSRSMRAAVENSAPATHLDYVSYLCIATKSPPSAAFPTYIEDYIAEELLKLEQSLDQYVDRFNTLDHSTWTEGMSTPLLDTTDTGVTTDKISKVLFLPYHGKHPFSTKPT